MNATIKVFLGLLTGSLLGAIIGLLLAPRKGVETRTLIADAWTRRCKESEQAVKKTVDDNAQVLLEKARQISHDLEEAGRRFIAAEKG
jgi:gas vesicle protein